MHDDNRFKLSVCIPTYNRAEYLPGTVGSVLDQLDDATRERVEIVISDNASTDHSARVIEDLRGRHPYVTYHRWDRNVGPDRNYLKAAALAGGEYIWFLGSDDRVVAGGVPRVLQDVADSGADILLYDRLESRGTLSAPAVRTTWSALPGDYACDTRQGFGDFIHYLQNCRSLGGVFSFISDIVVRRTRWEAIPEKETFVGSAYPHVHVLFEILKQGARFDYAKYHLIHCLIGNDTFCPDDSLESLYRRLKLDVDGYRDISFAVFGSDSPVTTELFKCLDRSIPKRVVAGLRYRMVKEASATKKRMEHLLYNSGCRSRFFYFKTCYPKVFLMNLLKKILSWSRT